MLYCKSEMAKLLFVCEKNPFSPDGSPSLLSSSRNTGRRDLQGARNANQNDQTYSRNYKTWSYRKLAEKVGELVSEGHLEVYMVALEDQPEGSFEVCKNMLSGIRAMDLCAFCLYEIVVDSFHRQ